MKGEVLGAFQVQIYQEILLYSNARIVLVEPSGDHWPSLALANHNVFRLDAGGKVVWQVRREESPTRASWEKLHELARQRHAEGSRDSAYGPEGYWDPFVRLYLLNCPEAKAGDAHTVIWQPGCEVCLNTRMTSYLLDIDTGIATCTGEQVK